MPAAHDDARLAARAQRGDKEAFAELYEHYLDHMYRYIFYRVGNHHDAEDLTELVFLKAWENLASYRGEVPFRAWIYRIAHNATIDYYRTNKQLLPLAEHHLPADERADPAAGAQALETSVRLARALSRLSPAQQQVILLRFISGLSAREVGAIMGRGEGAIRVLQYRALKAMRTLLTVEEIAHASPD